MFKEKIKGFIAGTVVTAILLASPFSMAQSITRNIQAVFNSVNLKVNGQTVQADNILYNGTTYVPLRAVAEALDKEVGWDQKTNTASINDKVVVAKPSTSYSRTNPAPVGTKQIITVSDFLDNYTTEVTVTETIRGQKAWELIKAANMFNSEPGADEEYILAKIKVKVIDVKDDKKLDISGLSFKTYNDKNVEYDYTSVVEPDPSLRTSLYTGGEHEGYAAYKVKKSDTSPKLVYGQKYDGTGGIWFKLNK